MAADDVGLLVCARHVLGGSSGGMIVQRMAIERPSRALSLSSIMSTTGKCANNEATPKAIAIIGRTSMLSRKETISEAAARARFLAGTAFAFNEDRHLRRAATAFDRANNTGGKARHRDASDRTAGLRTIAVPVVIHGDAEPVVTASDGRATASVVPDARLVIISGLGHERLGHELPRDVEQQTIDETVANAQRAGFTPLKGRVK